MTPLVAARQTITDRTAAAIQDTLAGRRRGLRTILPFMGPAIVASVAYMDPGNYATNIQAGSQYGYDLLWVALLANLVAMVFQAMSAKLGIVTGRNLAELCRDYFPRPLVLAMWAVSEVAAMATDLAEFLGGAIGLSLLFGMPLLAGMAVTAVIVYAILLTEHTGWRPIELIIGGFVGLIGLCYGLELLVVPADWHAVLIHTVSPHLADAASVTLAVGMIGATVMPHAIYLHSGLTQSRVQPANDQERRLLIRYSNREVVAALTLAGVVNLAMIVMASAAFHAGYRDVAEIQTAYRTLIPLFGAGAAGIFLVSLMASGISSSAVGTLAGQMIMQGFVGARIPLWVRRAVTMVPAFAVVGLGYDPTRSLVLSQVVLSLALPVPMLALLVLSRKPTVMGRFALRPGMALLSLVATVTVLALNALLLVQLAGVNVPGLG